MLPSSADTGAQGRARGFSLLEVLVAFVVLALTLAVIMRIFSQGLSRVSDSEYHARAVMLAESKLAELGAGIPLEEGEVSGDSKDALHWRVRLAAYDTDKAKAAKDGKEFRPMTDGKEAAVALPVRLLQVEVEVSRAGTPNASRSIRLVTLKLAPKTAL